MKNKWIHGLRAMLVLLTVFLASGTGAEAKPSSLYLADVKMDYYYVQISAMLNITTDTIDGFRIYEAPADMTPDENPEQFVLVDDISVYTDERELYMENGYVYWLAYRSEKAFAPGLHTYYITAYNNDGESDPSNIFVNTNPPLEQEPIDYLYFVNYPESTAKIGTEYVYVPQIETSLEGAIKFKWDDMMGVEIPEGATLDQNTGEVRWTPTTSGQFVFYLMAYEEESQLGSYQSWSVYVMECDVPPTISLNVVAEEHEKPFAFGSVMFLKTNNLDWDPVNMAGVIDIMAPETTVVSNLIDKGTYYMYVTGYGIKSYWYGGTEDPATAVPVTIECAEEYAFDINIDLFMTVPDVSVKGSVVNDATGEPVPYAMVEFIGSSDGGLTTAYFSASTDESGNYEVMVTSENEYIIRSMVLDYWYEGKEYDRKYLPQYYYLADDITEAKTMKFEENTDGIDFRLKERTPFDNTMTGTVKKSDGGLSLAGTYVIAFLIDGSADDYGFLYSGVTMISDNEGNFSGKDFIPGKYVVLAMPMEYDVMPGMYVEGDVATWEWEKATIIEIGETSAIENVHILLDNVIREVGVCVVEGNIGSKGELKAKANNVQGKTAVNGVRLYLADSQGKTVANTTTDELGYFRMDQVAPGTYTLKADKVGYDKYEQVITLGNGNNEINTEFELEPSGAAGVDDGGTLLSGAYPNPAHDVVNFDIDGSGAGSTLRMFDSKGLLVMSRTFDAVAGTGGISLDVSSMPAGAYLVNIRTSDKDMNYPVMIVR